MDNNTISKGDLVAAIYEAGVNRGDLVFVQSRLFSFGKPEGVASSEDLAKLHFDAFQEVLGPDGTLSVLTSFEDYGRYATPFVLETSPSRMGAFSEYVRRHPDAVRSVHPIMSVTSLGKSAVEISGEPHHEGFGYDSPWGRLHRKNAKLVVYGGGFKDGMTFFHYIEAMHGVPYQYVKLYDAPVYAGGQAQTGPFTMFVRYLDFAIAYDSEPFEKLLLSSGLGRGVTVGRTQINVVGAQDAFNLGIEALRANRYFFLKLPPQFRRGDIPLDGPTGSMRESYNSAAETPRPSS